MKSLKLLLYFLIATPLFAQEDTYYPWFNLNIVDAGFTILETGDPDYRFAGSFEFLFGKEIYSYTSFGGMFIKDVYLHLNTGMGFYIFDHRNLQTGLGWSMSWNVFALGIGYAYEKINNKHSAVFSVSSSLHLRYHFHKKTAIFIALVTQGYTDFTKYVPYFGYSSGIAF